MCQCCFVTCDRILIRDCHSTALPVPLVAGSHLRELAAHLLDLTHRLLALPPATALTPTVSTLSGLVTARLGVICTATTWVFLSLIMMTDIPKVLLMTHSIKLGVMNIPGPAGDLHGDDLGVPEVEEQEGVRARAGRRDHQQPAWGMTGHGSSGA